MLLIPATNDNYRSDKKAKTVSLIQQNSHQRGQLHLTKIEKKHFKPASSKTYKMSQMKSKHPDLHSMQVIGPLIRDFFFFFFFFTNKMCSFRSRHSDLGLYCLHMIFCQQLWGTNFRTFTVIKYLSNYSLANNKCLNVTQF